MTTTTATKAPKASASDIPDIPKYQLSNRQTLHILKRCFGFLRPYWRLTAGAYVLMLLITGLSVITPQLIRWIVDVGIAQHNVSQMGWSVIALLVITLFKGVLTFLQGRWTEVASQSVAYDLRNTLQHKLTNLSFSFHDRSRAGQLLSRAIQDVERIRFLTGRATLRIVNGVLLFFVTLGVLLWMNPRLALLAVCLMPLLANRALKFGSQYRPLSRMIQNQVGVMTARLEENLRGARTVKAFAQEDAEIERFEQQNENWFNLVRYAARLQAINIPLLDLIANFGLVFVIWYGGLLVVRDQLTLGELVAFTTYVGQMAQPVRMLGMIIPAIAMAGAAGERVFRILDTESEVKDAPDAVPLPPITGRVRFENVSFGYIDRDDVLSNIDLEARPGQVIALLGATGSGKSTITNLIPRFYEATEGRITIDGHDIRTVTLESLRRQIGIVLQESTLFAATIRENIAFGRPDASEEEIIAAAKAAQAHDFITQMQDGYETKVGERGVTLSGGQKQRVAIARALITDPRILILDDATASVDTETEQLIQQALDRLMENRTTFVITHRLSTMRRADLILVLKKGRIVAKGTHRSLHETSPLYAEIYRRQLRPQEQLPPKQEQPADGAAIPLSGLAKGQRP